jgi:hypothetical protein
MYINRTLLLGLALMLVSFPVILHWLTSDHTAWYRPYIVWTTVIIIAWWSQRSRHPDEL